MAQGRGVQDWHRACLDLAVLYIIRVYNLPQNTVLIIKAATSWSPFSIPYSSPYRPV